MKGCDLFVVVEESCFVICKLNRKRYDSDVWDVLYDSAVELAESINFNPSLPRNDAAARQQNRPNVPVANPSGYWKLNLYFPFVDQLMSLLEAEPQYIAQHLLTKKSR
ncbi:hypothetical protein DPMN_008956 [Dreissena polymorpha]|uniref:Uncharacterized protein n=1 Tax=Dreissena polymorpha TaxID=45954 RepID=A0A9D4RZM0_DREPO|nr:hypothetical protein DPMN_008956 [Dreissena polymorpha]